MYGLKDSAQLHVVTTT